MIRAFTPPFPSLAFALSLIFTLGFADTLEAQQLPKDRIHAKAARAILDAWHAESPEPGERKLHIVCWRPQDRDFAAGHRRRVPETMEHIRNFYATEMERNGLGKRTFNLDHDAAGKLVIHEVTGAGNYADYGMPDGQKIRNECLPVLRAAGIDANTETILIFTNLSDWDPEKNTFVHKSPYYAGGSHRAGTAWQLDSPELEPGNLRLKEPIIRDGQYGRISLGKHNSIFIGGIAHEMGHGFGLPHCRARDEEAEAHGTALMGSGNRSYGDELRGEGRGSFITLAHALRLASHPQFSGSVKGLHTNPTTEFDDLVLFSDAKRFAIAGTITSSLPAYAIIAYLDPAGGGDYDSRTVVAVPDESGRFRLICDALVPGKNAELRIVACLVNGATKTWRNSYRVEHDGTVNVTAMQTALELSDFATALNNKDFGQAQSIRNALPSKGNLQKIADAVLNGMARNRKVVSASEIAKTHSSWPLSQIKPAEVSVGWGRPAYDHVPGSDPFLIAGAEVFETGIYAHANARHRYDLTDGNWKELTGKCGIPAQRGSVVFVIKTDGKEVFRSRKTEGGQTHAYTVDLQGVKSLELIVEDAGDGKGSDWGFWLEPQLRR